MRVSLLVSLGILFLSSVWGQDYPDPTTLNIGAPGCIQGSCPPILNGYQWERWNADRLPGV